MILEEYRSVWKNIQESFYDFTELMVPSLNIDIMRNECQMVSKISVGHVPSCNFPCEYFLSLALLQFSLLFLFFSFYKPIWCHIYHQSFYCWIDCDNGHCAKYLKIKVDPKQWLTNPNPLWTSTQVLNDPVIQIICVLKPSLLKSMPPTLIQEAKSKKAENLKMNPSLCTNYMLLTNCGYLDRILP